MAHLSSVLSQCGWKVLQVCLELKKTHTPQISFENRWENNTENSEMQLVDYSVVCISCQKCMNVLWHFIVNDCVVSEYRLHAFW